MTKIHMVLQGKGGVGKSMIAATLAQYKAGKRSRFASIPIRSIRRSRGTKP